ncbi:MAG: class I SAM-dependent methyltransferase [Archangiaceae bacterium]|nr:class I SAM-dependent methyltransferase [Archangiaceae bacterium]
MKMTHVWYQLQHRTMAAIASRATGLWHFAMQAPQPLRDPSAREAIHQSLRSLFERDLQNVEAGHYPMELALNFPYLEHAAAFPAAVADSPRMLWKRFRDDFAGLPDDVDLSSFPHYYRRTFHWQPDGWLSERSARIYDMEVEFLFWGAADVMRRMTLPALGELKAKERPRVLDVACGTGRFLSTIHALLPHARLYGVDLSPHYISRARENLRHVPGGVGLLVENAEALPLEASSFDAAVSVFLFHELPHDARRNVMREAWRVLAPGGRFVICDSLQRADAQALGLRDFSEWFPAAYHEPYYKGYLGDDLAAALGECGFAVESSSCHGVSKVVVARKPLTAARA